MYYKQSPGSSLKAEQPDSIYIIFLPFKGIGIEGLYLFLIQGCSAKSFGFINIKTTLK